jgi:predicted nucleic acid-binding protein
VFCRTPEDAASVCGECIQRYVEIEKTATALLDNWDETEAYSVDLEDALRAALAQREGDDG